MGIALKPVTPGTMQSPEAAPLGDWLGLRARLAAAHATRRALLGEFAVPVSAEGSFAPAAAQALAHSEEDLIRVNRTGLADGKAPWGMDLDLAGQVEPGERGK